MLHSDYANILRVSLNLECLSNREQRINKQIPSKALTKQLVLSSSSLQLKNANSKKAFFFWTEERQCKILLSLVLVKIKLLIK